MKIKKLVTLLSTLTLFAMATPVFATGTDTEDSASTGMATQQESGYSVGPVLSKNQTDDSLGYFDIKWTPGDTDTIGITIQNDTDSDKKFTLDVNKALTNANGALVYNDSSQNENGERFKINDLVSFDKEVTVKARSSETFTSDINFPKEDFNGVLMGGVHVREVTEDKELQNREVAMEYSYAYPIILRGNIDERPEIKINFDEFGVRQNESLFFEFNTPFTNENENYLREVSFDVSVKNESGEEVYGESKNNLILTPETTVPLSTLITDPIEPGVYDVTVTITHKDNVWTETQQVEVTKKESQEIKEDTGARRGTAMDEKEDNNTLTIVLISVIAVLGVVVVTFAVKSSKRKDTK